MGYLITETDEQGNLIKDYIWQEGMHPVAQIDNNAGTESVVYLYTDHLITNRLATNQSQAVVWRWEGEAFGNTPAQDLGGVSVNLRFPGQYFDEETGLHYNHHRYYSPEIGRYITSDPIGLGGGLNTYAYVYNNPIKYTDSLGLLVDAYYDSSSGTVTVVDRDTGQIASGPAISGGVPFGDRLPNGPYEILDQARNPESFRLDPLDDNLRDDVHDPTGRDRFRLHEPGNTIGCIAVEEQNDWDKIRNLINNTRTDTVMDN